MRGFPPFHGGPVTTSRCSNRERLAGLHTLFTSLIEGLAKQRLGGELAEFPRACSPTISGDAAKGSTESVTSRAAFGSYVSCVMVVSSRKPPPPRWATPAEAAVWLGVTPTTNRSGRTVPLKTTASAATVDLLPALVRAHRARRAALGIQLVRAEALTFSTLTGKPHHQRSALRAVQNAAKDAKLGHVTVHDLRHSLVANALDAGLTLAEASRLARHASPAVTASVYADVLEAKRDALGAKLAQTGFGA